LGRAAVKKTVAGRYDMLPQFCHHLLPLPQLFHLPPVIQVEPSQFSLLFELQMKQSVHLNKKNSTHKEKRKKQSMALCTQIIRTSWFSFGFGGCALDLERQAPDFSFFWLKCLIRKKQSLIWIQDAG
jgi:hypothetical protein